MPRPLMRLASLILLGLGGLLGACATNPVTGDRDLVLMSERQEIALGHDYHRQILKQYSRYDDPALQAYVDELGQRLAKQSHRSDLDFHFTVLDSPEINAFALPGGYVYITRGIMAYLNSEAELAGVIGHEIGHVTARHSVRQQSTAVVTGVLSGILAQAAGVNPNNDLVGMLNTAIVRGYGREHELEADRLGAEYLARDGRDPEHMIGVVRLLKNQELYAADQGNGGSRGGYHALFATHPDNDLRLQQVIRAANQYKQGDWRDAGAERYLRAIEGMRFGASDDQGVVRGRYFYHASLNAQLTAPAGWRVDNQPDQLLMIAADDDARLQVKVEDADGAESARDYLERKLGKAKADDPRELQRGELRGHALSIVSGDTPYGRRKVRLSAMRYDGNIWLFSAATQSHADFELLRDTFDEVALSLSPLDDAGRDAARPLQIELVTAGSGGYRQIASDSAFGEEGVARLRLLNGDYPDGEPDPGRLVKVAR